MESCDSIALEGWFGSGQCGEEKLGYCQVDGSEDSCSRDIILALISSEQLWSPNEWLGFHLVIRGSRRCSWAYILWSSLMFLCNVSFAVGNEEKVCC